MCSGVETREDASGWRLSVPVPVALCLSQHPQGSSFGLSLFKGFLGRGASLWARYGRDGEIRGEYGRGGAELGQPGARDMRGSFSATLQIFRVITRHCHQGKLQSEN